MNEKQAREKREYYNSLLSIRLENQEEIEQIKQRLLYFYVGKDRLLLDYRVKYDQELKAELIDLDTQINELTGIFKIMKNYVKNNRVV